MAQRRLNVGQRLRRWPTLSRRWACPDRVISENQLDHAPTHIIGRGHPSVVITFTESVNLPSILSSHQEQNVSSITLKSGPYDPAVYNGQRVGKRTFQCWSIGNSFLVLYGLRISLSVLVIVRAPLVPVSRPNDDRLPAHTLSRPVGWILL